MGVRIAIDDFGTGYSNLAYLRPAARAQPEAGRAVRRQGLRPGTTTRPADERSCGVLVQLAHVLGLTVTAESVENAGPTAPSSRSRL